MYRRIFLAFALIVFNLASWAQAQPFPSKPLTVVVPYLPGGVIDVIVRSVGERVLQTTGQPSVIDYRPGAGTLIGTEAVARAPADGYTLLLASPAHTVNASLYSKLNFDPIKSFAPVIMVGMVPNAILVNPSLSAKNLAEFVAYAKARPGQLNYGSGGTGSTLHLVGELLKQLAGIDIVHVPYKGAPAAIAALLAGDVAMAPIGMSMAKPRVQAGQLRALAITAPKRSPAMPNVPTVVESGFPGLVVNTWYAYLAPAGTSDSVVAKLNAEIAAALRHPEAETRLLNIGAELNPGSPEDLRKFLVSDIERWAKVIKQAGIKLE